MCLKTNFSLLLCHLRNMWSSICILSVFVHACWTFNFAPAKIWSVIRRIEIVKGKVFKKLDSDALMKRAPREIFNETLKQCFFSVCHKKFLQNVYFMTHLQQWTFPSRRKILFSPQQNEEKFSACLTRSRSLKLIISWKWIQKQQALFLCFYGFYSLMKICRKEIMINHQEIKADYFYNLIFPWLTSRNINLWKTRV